MLLGEQHADNKNSLQLLVALKRSCAFELNDD